MLVRRLRLTTWLRRAAAQVMHVGALAYTEPAAVACELATKVHIIPDMGSATVESANPVPVMPTDEQRRPAHKQLDSLRGLGGVTLI